MNKNIPRYLIIATIHGSVQYASAFDDLNEAAYHAGMYGGDWLTILRSRRYGSYGFPSKRDEMRFAKMFTQYSKEWAIWRITYSQRVARMEMRKSVALPNHEPNGEGVP